MVVIPGPDIEELVPEVGGVVVPVPPLPPPPTVMV
jgi:hypothetical protein